MGTFYRLSKTRRRTRSTGFFANREHCRRPTFYEHSLEIRRRLIALDPGNTQYRLGLAVTLARFGPCFKCWANQTWRLKECANHAIADQLYRKRTTSPLFKSLQSSCISR